MKKNTGMALGIACAGLIFSCAAAAQESAPGKHASETGEVKECPEVYMFEKQILAKRNEIKTVESRMKSLGREQKAQIETQKSSQRAEKKAQLEGLKQTDPVKYEQTMARQFERQKKREAQRKQNVQEGSSQPKMTHEQWLAKLKTNNPKMYTLAIKKDALGKEIRMLRGQMQKARQACMSKK